MNLADYIEHISTFFQNDVYGIPLSFILWGVLGIVFILFLFSGPKSRSFISRIWDLFVVLFATGFLIGCLVVGHHYGKEYDLPAIGVFVGVAVFAAVFYMFSSWRRARHNAQEREKLAAFLRKPKKR